MPKDNTQADDPVEEMNRNLSQITESTRITKVTSKSDLITIGFERVTKHGVFKATLEHDDKANPEFYQAMAALSKACCETLDMPRDWIERHKSNIVSVDYASDENEKMGVIVSLIVPFPKQGACSMSVPRMREKGSSGGNIMTDKMLNLVKAVLREAQDYLDGDRAQQDIVDGKTKAAGEKED